MMIKPKPVFLALVLLLLANAPCPSAELTVSQEELQKYPLMDKIPGNPPKSGRRYWTEPFTPLASNGAYVSVIVRNQQFELWRGSLVTKQSDTQGRLNHLYQKAQVDERVCIVSRGPDIRSLGKGEPRFDATLINDVSPPDQPGELSTNRGFTRTYMTWFPDIGYVFYCCVTHGYSPGAVPMLPAIMVSKTGEAGSWKYLGKMKGEPLAEAKERVVWCDGGSIHRLDSGRWRAYLNGYGQVTTAVESDRLEGPWQFIRDDKGKIRELLPDFPKDPSYGQGIWTNVLRTGKSEWHLWLTDTWPAQAVWHFSSSNGLDWQLYGQQPEITRLTIGGHGIKCLRTYLDPNSKEIVGLLSVWGQATADTPAGWVLHANRMPLGLKPAVE